jgi:hypothetical protein
MMKKYQTENLLLLRLYRPGFLMEAKGTKKNK